MFIAEISTINVVGTVDVHVHTVITIQVILVSLIYLWYKDLFVLYFRYIKPHIDSIKVSVFSNLTPAWVIQYLNTNQNSDWGKTQHF